MEGVFSRFEILLVVKGFLLDGKSYYFDVQNDVVSQCMSQQVRIEAHDREKWHIDIRLEDIEVTWIIDINDFYMGINHMGRNFRCII
jgi:hypothetical protein